MRNICAIHERHHALGSSRPSNKKSAGILQRTKAIVLAAAAAIALTIGTAATSNATPITLQNNNSSLSLNYAGDSGNADGMYNWTVGATNQLNQQSFWYRIGSTGTQTPIDKLTVQGSPTILDTDGDTKNDWAQITYADAAKSFTLATTYALAGGSANSGRSDIAETIKITNTSGKPLDFHFFEYSDFNLGGSINGQSLTMTGSNTATDTLPGGSVVTETVVSPRASSYEAGSFPALGNALSSTTDLALNNTATVNNTDAEWAFEWDMVLSPGSSFVVGLDNQIRSVPEPTSAVALLGIGGAFLIRRRQTVAVEA